MEKFKDRKGNLHTKPDKREVLKRLSAYGIAVKNNCEILLIKPSWKEEFELPGGAIEDEETIAQGLRREFMEETGFSIKVLTPLPLEVKKELFYADDIDKYYNSELLFFPVEILGNRKAEFVNTSEIVEQIWCKLDELIKIKINNTHLEILKSATGSEIGSDKHDKNL